MACCFGGSKVSKLKNKSPPAITSNGSLSSKLEQVGHIPTSSCASIPLPSGTCVDGRSSSLNSGAESSSKDSHQGRTTTLPDANSRGTSSESKSREPGDLRSHRSHPPISSTVIGNGLLDGERVPQSFTKPPQRTTASESHAGTGAASDAVIRVVALLQELLGMTADRRKTHVPKIMAMLCTRLGVSWACLTCVTPTGTYMQHTGAAFGTECSQPTRFMFDNGRAQNVSHGGYGGYHSQIGRGSSYRGTVSRQSSTSSVNQFPVEVPCCEAYPVKGSSSSVELMLKFKKMLSGIAYTHSDNSNSTDREGVNPSRLSRSQHPDLLVSGEDNEKVWVEGEVQGSRLFSSSMGGTLPKDWRQVARDKGLRSMLCCPVYSSSDPTTIVGCLSFGMMEAVAWKEVWWYSSMLLITGWAASAITESRFVARACMFERLLGAETINELAASVVYGIPNFLKDVSLGQVEARLALVSSTLSQAIVYVQPQVNHVSTELYQVGHINSDDVASGDGGDEFSGVQLGYSEVPDDGAMFEMGDEFNTYGNSISRHSTTTMNSTNTNMNLKKKELERVCISTDSTLLMSVLEAGDIMTIKDSLAYFGRDRLVAGDLALHGRSGTAGMLMLLPLIHKCRALGCIYIFARNGINSALPRSLWTELSEHMSRAVFTKLVEKLRFEWYNILSDDALSKDSHDGEGDRIHKSNSLIMLRPSIGPQHPAIAAVKQQKTIRRRERSNLNALSGLGAKPTHPGSSRSSKMQRVSLGGSQGSLETSSQEKERLSPSTLNKKLSNGVIEEEVDELRVAAPLCKSVSAGVGTEPQVVAKRAVVEKAGKSTRSKPRPKLPPRLLDHKQPSSADSLQAACGSFGTEVTVGLETPPKELTLTRMNQSPLPVSAMTARIKQSLDRRIEGMSKESNSSNCSLVSIDDEERRSPTADTTKFKLDLQCWPELVDIVYEMHRTHHMSLYYCSFQGAPAAVKVMRLPTNTDMTGPQGQTPVRHGQLLSRLSHMQHKCLLNTHIVYPDMFEVLIGCGGETQGVFLTGVQPRRERCRRGLAVVLEYFPSVSLREVINRKQLMPRAMNHNVDDSSIHSSLGNSNSSGHHTQSTTPPNSTTRGTSSYKGVPGRENSFNNALSPTNNMSPTATPQPRRSPSSISGINSFYTLPLAEAAARIASTSGGGGGALPRANLPLGPGVAAARAIPSHGQGGAAASSSSTCPAVHAYMLSGSGEQQPSAQDPCIGPGGPGPGPRGSPSSGTGVPASSFSPSPPKQGGALTNSSTSPTEKGYMQQDDSQRDSKPQAAVSSVCSSEPLPLIGIIKNILLQVAQAVAYLHQSGLIHGEVRAESVLVYKASGATAVSYFGLGSSVGSHIRSTSFINPPSARPSNPVNTHGSDISPPNEEVPTDVAVKLKDAGMTSITLNKGQLIVRKMLSRPRSNLVPYIAPEIFRGERPTKACDIYSFGLLMWEMYTGQLVFSDIASSATNLIQSVVVEGLRPQFPESTPAWYCLLAKRCWAPSPKHRPSIKNILLVLMADTKRDKPASSTHSSNDKSFYTDAGPKTASSLVYSDKPAGNDKPGGTEAEGAHGGPQASQLIYSDKPAGNDKPGGTEAEAQSLDKQAEGAHGGPQAS